MDTRTKTQVAIELARHPKLRNYVASEADQISYWMRIGSKPYLEAFLNLTNAEPDDLSQGVALKALGDAQAYCWAGDGQ
jgi:hypothetical protein